VRARGGQLFCNRGSASPGARFRVRPVDLPSGSTVVGCCRNCSARCGAATCARVAFRDVLRRLRACVRAWVFLFPGCRVRSVDLGVTFSRVTAAGSVKCGRGVGESEHLMTRARAGAAVSGKTGCCLDGLRGTRTLTTHMGICFSRGFKQDCQLCMLLVQDY